MQDCFTKYRRGDLNKLCKLSKHSDVYYNLVCLWLWFYLWVGLRERALCLQGLKHNQHSKTRSETGTKFRFTNNDVNKIGLNVGLLQVLFIKYHGSDLRYEIRLGAVIRALKVNVVERSIIDVRPLLDVSNKTFAW